MTDKEKIRAEIERRMKGKCPIVCSYIIYEDILNFIDSMQEEPAPKIFEDMLNAKTPAESLGISAEEHEKIVDACLYGKEPELIDEDDLPTKKDYRERYKRIAESEEFKKNHDGMSIGDTVTVEGE
jgi:hypothetical protein